MNIPCSCRVWRSYLGIRSHSLAARSSRTTCRGSSTLEPSRHRRRLAWEINVMRVMWSATWVREFAHLARSCWRWWSGGGKFQQARREIRTILAVQSVLYPDPKWCASPMRFPTIRFESRVPHSGMRGCLRSFLNWGDLDLILSDLWVYWSLDPFLQVGSEDSHFLPSKA